MQHPLNILLINEEAQIQVLLFKLLSSSDTAVHTCLGGKDAAAVLPTIYADVIITDFMLSYKSGLEWLMYVRSKAANPLSKVMVLSSIQDPETISECQKMGFDTFFTVPFEPEKLMEEVRRCFQSPSGSIVKICPGTSRSTMSSVTASLKIYPSRDW